MGRLAPVVMLAVLLAACQPNRTPVASPLPSPTPHTPVTQTLLQAADVPAGLNECAGSGLFGAYLAALTTANPSLAKMLGDQWKSLQQSGARDAAIALYAADTAACSAELGASGTIKSAASMVITFGDEGQADRAWQAGVFGLAPPAPGAAPPGIVRGATTGLGPSSWTYDRPPVRLACWRKSVFVAVVVFGSLDPAAFKAAAAAVDARLN